MNTAKDKAVDRKMPEYGLFVANTDYMSEEELDNACQQVDLGDAALEAVDRALALGKDDVLLCEATCLDYAEHALSLDGGPKEVWLVPPLLGGVEPTAEQLESFEAAMAESHKRPLGLLKSREPKFKGFAASLPEGSFKLLITTRYCGVPISSALEWPEYNAFWIDMLNTEGATGAVIYPPLDEQDARLPSLREGNTFTDYFAQAVELPSGHIVLSLGDPGAPFHMEDLTDPDNPWECEVTPIGLSANDGCLAPSMHRDGIKVLDEPTLGILASSISRGTPLSEKDLDVKERLGSRVADAPCTPAAASKQRKGWKPKDKRNFGAVGGVYTEFDRWVIAREDDLYYVDGSCFKKGEIWPAVLGSIPENQERYTVNKYDGEVLLVSRSSREAVVYKAVRPTLIGNSVFVIRLKSEIDRHYLACWMRSNYSKSWLHEEGKILSKRILSSLPVPILDEKVMKQVVLHERSIDERILELREEIGKLEHGNRFAPLAAVRERKPEEDGNE